jgi:hypothetical protein
MDEGGKEEVAPNGVSPRVIGVDIDAQSILMSGDGAPVVIPAGARSLDVHVSVPDYVAVGLTAEILSGEDS